MKKTAITDDLVDFLQYMESTNPQSIRVFTSKTEEEFIEGVEAALLHAVVCLEAGRSEYSTLEELGLSKMLCNELRAAAIPATAEEHTNGHVDLTVKHPNGRSYRYLGECKIWKGVRYHEKGMSQLLKDYSTGRDRRGCCIEFVRLPDTAGKLKALRKHLDQKRPLGQRAVAVDHVLMKGGFITTHRHSSGWDMEVLHFGCNLHDPSATPKKTGSRTPKSSTKKKHK